MKSKFLQGLAIVIILEVGLVHYFSAQHEFEDAWILGYMFIANFLGSLVAAYGIYRRKTRGWGLGFLISAGSIGAYIWSRTSGLPGLRPEEWLYPWGVTSILAESLFCLLVFMRPWKDRPVDAAPAANSGRLGTYLFSTISLIALITVNFYTYQMDARYPELDHAHVFFLWQVRLQPEISRTTLEAQYGMDVSRVAVSAMDSIIDVRLKIMDAEKADQLLEDGNFALLVGDTLIPAPHVNRHMIGKRRAVVFFPNLDRIVQNGTPVSLVFENLRIEPVAAN